MPFRAEDFSGKGDAVKRKTKKLLTRLLILGVPVVVLLIGLHSGDLPASILALRDANPLFLILGMLCTLGFLSGAALSIRSSLRAQGYHLSLKHSLLVSVIGEYYANITPGASGGQPMMIYRMHKYKIPVGAATSSIATHFIAFQFMVSLLSTVLGVTHWDFLLQQVGDGLPILILGYTVNTLAVLLVLMLCFYKAPVYWLLEKIIKVGAKLHLVKDPERMRHKFIETTENFHDGMQVLIRHPVEIVRQLAICFAQLACHMSVMFFVYHALGLSGVSYTEITMMALMEYISAAYAPLPGASGARESVFSLYFEHIFPDASKLAALLIWRFSTYYFTLLVGMVTVYITNLRSKEKIPDAE